MSKGIVKKSLKWLMWIAIGLLGLILLVVCAIYIPAVQDFAVKKALEIVNQSGDLEISAAKLRLKFPLRIEADSVLIKQQGDTMLLAGKLKAHAAMLPLIKGKVEASDISLDNIYFKQGPPDSLLYLRARVTSATIDQANVQLSKQTVDINRLSVNSGIVSLAIGVDTVTKPATPPSEVKWNVKVRQLDLTDLKYDMTMESTLRSIDASLGKLHVADTEVDLATNSIAINSISLDSISGQIFNDPDFVIAVKPEPTDTFPTRPWSIAVDRIALNNGNVLYAREGAEPKPGFDLDYIAVDHIAIEVDTFRMVGTDLHVPVAKIYGAERSGLQLDAKGLFEMDSTQIRVNNFAINTLDSYFNIDAIYGMGQPADSQPIVADIKAEVGMADVQMAMPQLKEVISMLPQNRRLQLGADLHGTLADLRVERVSAAMRNYFDISFKGYARNVTDINNAIGHLDLNGNFADINFLKPKLMDKKTSKQVKLPPLSLRGDVNLNRGLIDGALKAIADNGDVALDASWNNRRTDYDISLNTNQFPVSSFLPGLGVGRVTAKADVKGHGLDIFSPKTYITANIDAIDVEYNHQKISNLAVNANLSNGVADIDLHSTNPVLNATINARGNLDSDTYQWTLDGSVAHIDLQALGLMDTVANARMVFAGNATLTPKEKAIKADLDISSVNLVLGKDRFTGDNIEAYFDATDSTTSATLTNRDLHLALYSPMQLDSILPCIDSTMTALDSMIAHRRADVIELQRLMPQFNLRLTAGRDNALRNYLASTGTTFYNLNLAMSNDSLINIEASVDTIISGTTRLDHIDFTAIQRNEYLRYKILVNNEPGTFDEFAKIQANGYLADDKFSIFVRQENIKGKTGYNLGSMIAMTDSTFTVRFIPYKPTIAYKQWTINNDNYIIVDTRHPHLDADLLMTNNISSLRLFTEHDFTATNHEQERINLTIKDVKIQEWLALSPYAPPMKGDLSADISVGTADNALNGQGTVTLADFTYNKRRVGTFDLNLDLSTNRSGAIYANTSLNIDGTKVITADGALNDTTATNPFHLDFDIDRLPLKVANPFITQTGCLDGYLNGHMDVIGSLKEPRFDGFIEFDSATVNVAMIGSSFRFDNEKIPVDSNIIRFNDYSIFGANSNPLKINGYVDATRITDVALNLALNADNMQVVNNNKRRGSDVYGKAFVSLDATAKGNLRFINVNAKVNLNPSTNVTYVIPDATTALASRSNSGMVKFVNFADTLAVEQADSLAAPPTAVNITAILNIETGATIGVDLSADGKNRAQLQPSGTLDYSLNPFGDSHLTGRINIDNGFVRYTPPLMSEKLFNFQSNSYVTFSGDMMNPAFHIEAIDNVLANVTQTGQNSRLITFDVILKVDGTLDQTDINFDLKTDDDVTVENELQSMSPDQRANQAMNLLLYNTYTGPNTKGNANIGGNALYSFLESTVNSWMANNIKGVDISFGIDQYERTTDGNSSTATSYSYKVSKSFLDDRIKVVVGGNYSTDLDSDESLSESLINDISVEYYLNNSGTMYVRLFRHTGFESILEGEVTQTGVGFVFKRKLRNLGDLFRRKKKQPQIALPTIIPPQVTNQK